MTVPEVTAVLGFTNDPQAAGQGTGTDKVVRWGGQPLRINVR